jgi:hypothetical protein
LLDEDGDPGAFGGSASRVENAVRCSGELVAIVLENVLVDAVTGLDSSAYQALEARHTVAVPRTGNVRLETVLEGVHDCGVSAQSWGTVGAGAPVFIGTMTLCSSPVL